VLSVVKKKRRGIVRDSTDDDVANGSFALLIQNPDPDMLVTCYWYTDHPTTSKKQQLS
jgi:hypothetical protein